MLEPSFLARRTYGVSNYVWIATIVAFCAALVPDAARRAIKSNSNQAVDWLPATYQESADLRWFGKHFSSGSFLVCTWNGCTLGNDKQLRELAEGLAARVLPPERAAVGEPERRLAEGPAATSGRWFRQILTGPSVLEQLTAAPLHLSYRAAAERLEGTLVGPRGLDPLGNTLGDASRQTCLVAFLSPEGYSSNDTMRAVCNELQRVACDECGVPRADFHLGGPPADNVAIDRAGAQSFARLSALSGLVGLVLAFLCYRSLSLTGIVVAVGTLCSAVSLSLVYYFGVGEVLLGGLAAPHLGKFDAVMMTMPAVVYVLGISGAVHIVNYYLEARRESGQAGAAERAVRKAWVPCTLAALTTAIGLASLAVSDIVPIKKFGAFTAVAILTTLAVLFSVLPVFLHRFPPPSRTTRRGRIRGFTSAKGWAQSSGEFILARHAWLTTAGLLVVGVISLGMFRLESSVRVLKLLDPRSKLITDYHWIEKNLANLVPMEVILTIPREKCRQGDEHAEADSQNYRMTMLERMRLVERIARRIEDLPEVSRTMSPATFAPESASGRASYAVNRALEKNHTSFDDYFVKESSTGVESTAIGRELWRIAARVSAVKDIDYGEFVDAIRDRVEPVLTVYRQRDKLLRLLHARGKRLQGAQLCILFRAAPEISTPPPDSRAGMLGALLRESGVTNRVDGKKGRVTAYNLAKLNSSPERTEARAALAQQNAVLVVDQSIKLPEGDLENHAVRLINLAERTPGSHTAAAIAASPEKGPRVVRAVYTGIVPLVFKTQKQLLASLGESMIWAVLTIAVVMSFMLRSPVAGAISMVPNVFPVVIVFGTLGWLGIKTDIGMMMTASVALGVAVDDTVHFLTWFRRGRQQGLDRQAATRLAYHRCALPMTQTTLIAGLGLAVFATSTFTPTRQFGTMMITMLGGALVGDLVLLPAILSGPLGRFFYPVDVAGDQPAAETRKGEVGVGKHIDERAVTVGQHVPSPPMEQASALELDRSVAGTDLPSPTSLRLDEAELSSSSHAPLWKKLRRFRRESRPNE